MENNLEVIPIFFAVDDGYVPFLAITLQSMTENASKKYYYSIKILYTNISEVNKKKIKKYEAENIKIEFVDLNYYIDEIKDDLYTRDYYDKTTYFRLFVPNLYPQYDKAIYLDCDTIIKGDISELYNIELENNLVGAVPDQSVRVIEQFQEYVEKVVGLSTYKKYFNAGVLVMNLDELRKIDFQGKFLYLLKTIKFAVAQDQDYLNRICKGRVKIIDDVWDVMPINQENIPEGEIKIIHYNLFYKPWHFNNVQYQEYFWKYAKKTEYYKNILEAQKNYTEEQKFQDMELLKNLKALCQMEADCVGDDRTIQKSQDRLNILKKIEELEKMGVFDADVEDDPPTIKLEAENVDYLKEKSTSKVKNKLANNIGRYYLRSLIKNNKLIIKEVNGIENLKSVKTGAMLTCNHFNPFDSFAIEKAFRMSKKNRTKKLYKVIREGNFTNFPGLYGFLFRNADTLPLSSSNRTMMEFMKAVDTILQNGDFILIYPEQSMWWNYKKPKPLKNGAFKLAARNNVPVIPIFITMKDTEIIGEDGFPIQEYYINVEKPIYPDSNLSENENTKIMREKNSEIWKNIYEDFYKMPLKYDTVKQEEKNGI